METKGRRRLKTNARGERLNAILLSIPLLTAILFCAALPAFGQASKDAAETAEPKPAGEKVYGISLTTMSGVFLGQSEEIVYKPNGDYLSQLLWDMMPVVYVGLQAEFAPRASTGKSGFFAALRGQFGLPGTTGDMEDRDWINSSELTHFSEHTNKTLSSMLFALESGWSFSQGIFALKPYLKFSYDYFSFEANDGYRKYLSDNWNKYPFYGVVISYTQMFTAVSGGLRLFNMITPRITAELYADAGYVFFYFDEDNHLVRDIQYHDIATQGFALTAGAQASYQITDVWRVSLCFTYRNISGVFGSIYARGMTDSVAADLPPGKTQVSAGAGAGLNLFDIGVSVTVSP